MDISQRRDMLKQIITERQEVPICELNKQFDVSSATLRNDLIYLERIGVCKRLFGKVIACTNPLPVNLNYGYIKNQAEKERIGKYAASLIQPGDSVLIYTGSTTRQIARFVNPEIDFIAVTNCLYTALELQSSENVQVVVLGGAMNRKICATFGIQTIQQIREFNLDKLFISVDGIDAKMGITNAMPFESEINQVVLECAKECIVVADHTKIGNVSFVQMGEIQQVNMLITDTGADPEAISDLKKAGVDVRLV